MRPHVKSGMDKTLAEAATNIACLMLGADVPAAAAAPETMDAREALPKDIKDMDNRVVRNCFLIDTVAKSEHLDVSFPARSPVASMVTQLESVFVQIVCPCSG